MFKKCVVLCMFNILIGSLVFFGCKKKEDVPSLDGSGRKIVATAPAPPTYNLYINYTVYLWIDPLTKCQYLSNSGSSTLIPRVDRTGKQICD